MDLRVRISGAADGSFEASPAYTAYVMALLFGVAVFALIDRQIFGMLLEPIKAEFEVSDTLLGLVTGLSFALFYSVADIPIARWADRGVRRPSIALAPFTLIFLLAPAPIALASMPLSALLTGAGIPGMHATTQALARPSMRALASALTLLLLSLVGFGFGSLIVGVMNDQLGATFGREAVRYSLSLVAVASLWSGAHNLLSARTLRADMQASPRDGAGPEIQ